MNLKYGNKQTVFCLTTTTSIPSSNFLFRFFVGRFYFIFYLPYEYRLSLMLFDSIFVDTLVWRPHCHEQKKICLSLY